MKTQFLLSCLFQNSVGGSHTVILGKRLGEFRPVARFHRACGASLVAQTVKNLSAMRETRVQSLGWEDPLEKGMVIYSSMLAWRIPMDRGAWWGTDHGIVTESDMTEATEHSSQTRD